jgi:hypothetical protein
VLKIAWAVAVIMLVAGVGLGAVVLLTPSPPAPSCAPPGQRTFQLPSANGLNYGAPLTASGQYLGAQWLRPADWHAARPALEADLDFIAASRLGSVQRIFVGLDQLMVWDPRTGFVRFDEASLDDFGQALRAFDERGLKTVVVLYDQEETSNPGNFRFEALDGHHAAMRRGYLEATAQFMRRFGSAPAVAGWDLFNEAYNSLGSEGGLSRPPGSGPVSPGYPDSTVHAWLRDLYNTAHCAAPSAWLTVSDTTELYWNDRPDVAKYEDVVDFYDIHVYDDHPQLRAWRSVLRKPYMLGEVAASTEDDHYRDQSLNAPVVGFWLDHGREAGLSAVLAHAADGVVFPPDRSGLTPTGALVAAAS